MKRAPDVDLEELVATVEKRVLARIAAALTSAALPSVYSTRRKCGPPGLADSACKATLPTIPGAVKRGRWWVIDRRRYEEWEAAQTAPRRGARQGARGPQDAFARDALAEAPPLPEEGRSRPGRALRRGRDAQGDHVPRPPGDGDHVDGGAW
jgi:hypothetical protein